MANSCESAQTGYDSYKLAQSNRFWLSFGLAVAIVIVSAIVHYRSASFRRIIETDELITLQSYTWAGVRADGTRRELASIADLESLPKCSMREFVIGCYCSLGRWSEPNNHIYHSLLVNGSLAAVRPTLVALRLPALLAVVGFAVVCAYLCCWAGWFFSAPLIALLCLWHPYLVAYGQTSRGYALTLLLTALWILLLVNLIQRPQSLWIGTGMTLTAISTFQTMVNLLVNWAAPVYMIVLLAPRWFCGRDADESHLVAFRRNLLVQLLCVMGVAFVFFFDRLPYVVSSATQYGHPIASISEGIRETVVAFDYLFPGRLWAFALLAACGVGWAVRMARARVLLLPYAVALLISLIYFFASSRFPYQRNFGVFLPLVLFGYAAAIQAAIDLGIGSRARTGAMMAASLLLTGGFVQPSFELDLRDRALTELSDYVTTATTGVQESAIVLLGRGVAYPIKLYLPADWTTADLPEEVETLQIVIIQKDAFPFTLSDDTPADSAFPVLWPDAARTRVGPYSIWSCPAVVSQADASDVSNRPRLALWYPPFEAVAVHAEKVFAAVRYAGLHYDGIYETYQAKLEVFSRLKCVLIEIPDSQPVSDPENLAAEEPTVRIRNIQQKFGGRLVFLASPGKSE